MASIPVTSKLIEDEPLELSVDVNEELALPENKDTGFSIRFNSKSSHESVITVPQEYIKGYLTVAK
jgi:hypothetical protein